MRRTRRIGLVFSVAALGLANAAQALAQSCQISDQIDPAQLESVRTAAQRYLDLAAKGDIAAIEANSVAEAAAEFPPIAKSTFEHLPAGSPAASREIFLLDADAEAVIPRAEFLCGTFSKTGQTANSAAIVLTKLRPATYAVVIFDIQPGPQGNLPDRLSLVLENAPANSSSQAKDERKDDWKLAAAFLRRAHMAGHDSAWFVARAKRFQEKDQRRNAWLYYVAARSLASPSPFMSTAVTDKLYDAVRDTQPADFPVDSKPLDFAAGTAHYQISSITAEGVASDVYVVVRYQTSDISNTVKTNAHSVVLIRAVVAKFPELRTAFAGIVARAVTPAGTDFGTMLNIKDLR
jgi:hypothetical protein